MDSSACHDSPEAVGLFHSMILFALNTEDDTEHHLFLVNHSFEQGTRMGRVGCVKLSTCHLRHSRRSLRWPISPVSLETGVGLLSHQVGRPTLTAWGCSSQVCSFLSGQCPVLSAVGLGCVFSRHAIFNHHIPRSPFLTHSHIFFCSLTMKLEESSLMEGNPAHSCPCKGTGPSGTWGHDRKIPT